MRTALLPALLLAAITAFAQSSRSISALGRIEPDNGIIRVTASQVSLEALGGIVDTLLVDEGDDVVKGQLLASTDAAPVLEAHVREAEVNLRYFLLVRPQSSQSSRDSIYSGLSAALFRVNRSKRRSASWISSIGRVTLAPE